MVQRKAKQRPKHNRAGTPNPGKRKAKVKRTLRLGQKRKEFAIWRDECRVAWFERVGKSE